MPERSWNLTKSGLERVLSCHVLRMLGLFDRPAGRKGAWGPAETTCNSAALQSH